MKDVEKKSGFFKALSDPIRLKIIDYLLKKQSPTCICELSEEIQRDQSVIFRHVQLLVQSGIIHAEKENKFLMCTIKDKEKIEMLLNSA